jgi:uncharacterized protein
MEDARNLTETEKNYAMFCHLSGFAGFFFPVGGGIIATFIIWLSKREESSWIDENGKASLNFQLSILLYTILAFPLCFIIIGIPIIGILWILKFVFLAIVSVKAGKGERQKYPITIPFIQ